MTVKAQGRAAGLVYLIVVLTGIFTLAYAPSQLIFDNDASTLQAMTRNLTLFRTSIFAGLAMCAAFLALPLALSRFLSVYGKNAAQAMIILVAASLPFSLLAYAQHWEIAKLVSAGAASPAAVATRLEGYDRWMDLASIFWGLWLAPLGWLVLKSGAIPRILGVLLLCGCVGYLANFAGPRFIEGYGTWPWPDWVAKLGSVGEIGTCLWLVLMGARR